jgi:hypothetical protein
MEWRSKEREKFSNVRGAKEKPVPQVMGKKPASRKQLEKKAGARSSTFPSAPSVSPPPFLFFAPPLLGVCD